MPIRLSPDTTARGRCAVSTAHPLATEAALEVLRSEGSAVDAAIAAQAVIATVMPQAAGLGGDALALIHKADGTTVAITGVGRSPAKAPGEWTLDGGGSVTVPGLVDAWLTMHQRDGRLSLTEVLEPARRLARAHTVSPSLVSAVNNQRQRLDRHGASDWALLSLRVGQIWSQPELSHLLSAIAAEGRPAFYSGNPARAICTAVQRAGGSLDPEDLAKHRTTVTPPLDVPWDGGMLCVQPPPTQGVLLAMAAQAVDQQQGERPGETEHWLVELTDAAFAHRSDVVRRGRALLDQPLPVDLERASRRGGARSYLHTAGVAVCDADGTVVSSLVSVFDDFGSGVFVPELGIVMANRAAGFTDGANAPAPGSFPVHTLAPAMLLPTSGGALGIATPGADGQVQTLLQILTRLRFDGDDLASAVARPRWRSENGSLLVETGHPATEQFVRRGHAVVNRELGDEVFGAVVAAGRDGQGAFAVADPRRGVQAGAA